MLSALLVVPLLAMVSGCDWDEKLPFRGNELDAGLLGFWWRVLPDTTYDLAVWTQALIEFRREGDGNTMRLWRAYGSDECPHVEGNSGKAVFTRRGKLYQLSTGPLSDFIEAAPYSLRNDTLSITREEQLEAYTVRYVRVLDTSSVNWVARRRACRRWLPREGAGDNKLARGL